MENETSKDPVQVTPTPQNIPLSKIHDLPGVYINQVPDRNYGGLVSSIQSGGVKEPVILRLREDGEYQLLAGYRRRRASELAKKQEIPALVYEMTMQEATSYYKQARVQADAPIPGKLIDPAQKEKKAKVPAEPKAPITAETAPEQKEPKKAPETVTPDDVPPWETKPPVPGVKKAEQKAHVPEKAKPTGKILIPPVVGDKTAVVQADEKKQVDKTVMAEKKEEKPVQSKTDEKQKAAAAQEQPEKPAESKANKTNEEPEKVVAVTGPAAKGPAGTAISQVFEERLSPPDEKALKDLPAPKEGESFFIVLHPGYLEKSKFNEFSVDKSSENYKELRKSIELGGIHDPVLTRLKPGGGLEILSGQRRHMVAAELNYPVPAIIQKIDDADAKIIVADGNLHRDKITTYDLSRALRMKMEGMKQKAGRRKKSDVTAEALNSDEKLAMEMGMSVSKLNRIIRLSEASKDVCDRVDDGSLALSIASAISFLKPKNQDEILHLADIGYKITNDRVERMKKVEKTGKLDEVTMRAILDDRDIAPKQVVPPAPVPIVQSSPASNVASGNATPVTVSVSQTPAVEPPVSNVVPMPASAAASPIPSTNGTTGQANDSTAVQGSANDTEPFKGAQERPEHTKVILSGDRLRKYFPDVTMTPREIEESVYDALEERKQRQEKIRPKETIFKKSGPSR